MDGDYAVDFEKGWIYQNQRKFYAIEKILHEKNDRISIVLPYSDEPEVFLCDRSKPHVWKRLFLFGPLSMINFQKDYVELLFHGSVSLTNWKYRYNYQDRSFTLSEQ